MYCMSSCGGSLEGRQSQNLQIQSFTKESQKANVKAKQTRAWSQHAVKVQDWKRKANNGLQILKECCPR